MNNNRKLYQSFIIWLFLMSGYAASAQEDKTLYEGKFEADSYFTTFEGSWKIVKNGNKTYVIFNDDFKAKKAPDLQIFLSGMSLDDINGKNATVKGSPLLVTKLNTYKGKARFERPGNPDLSSYRSIIVHCVEYSKLWGGSNLK